MKLDLTAPSVWDHVAATYAADFQPLLEQFVLEALRMAALEPESDVVDVACGPGTLSCHAARQGHRTRALDFSPEMIAALRRLAASDHYPAGSDCLRCHTRACGEVLGIRTRQLVGRKTTAGGDLLAEWIAAGRLKGAPADLSTLPSHPALGDTAASVEDRARAYLDVNRAICHLSDGPAPSTMDLRAGTPLGAVSVDEGERAVRVLCPRPGRP